MIGHQVNEKREIWDGGDVIGKTEVIAQDDANNLDNSLFQEVKNQLNPNILIFNKRKVNKKDNLLNNNGEVISNLLENLDLKHYIRKKSNKESKILNDKKDDVGKVEIVIGNIAEKILKFLRSEIVKKIEKATKKAITKAATVDL